MAKFVRDVFWRERGRGDGEERKGGQKELWASKKKRGTDVVAESNSEKGGSFCQVGWQTTG